MNRGRSLCDTLGGWEGDRGGCEAPIGVLLWKGGLVVAGGWVRREREKKRTKIEKQHLIRKINPIMTAYNEDVTSDAGCRVGEAVERSCGGVRGGGRGEEDVRFDFGPVEGFCFFGGVRDRGERGGRGRDGERGRERERRTNPNPTKTNH